MGIFKTKTKTNPFRFARMEKWCCENERFTGYAGLTDTGDIYLTWDVQNGIPVFSIHDKITDVDKFNEMHDLHGMLSGRWIESIYSIDYKNVGSKVIHNFSSSVINTTTSNITYEHRFDIPRGFSI